MLVNIYFNKKIYINTKSLFITILKKHGYLIIHLSHVQEIITQQTPNNTKQIQDPTIKFLKNQCISITPS